MLAALEMVDAVVVFEQDTPLELIGALQARCAREGRRLHSRRRSSARAKCEAWGGDVVIVPLTPGHSTTSTIEKTPWPLIPMLRARPPRTTSCAP